MSTDDQRPKLDEADYREYARKMNLFMEGPTTTYFEQLQTAGIELPEPEAVADADIRTKLWEVIAGLAAQRVYLDQTDHLTDRELYAWLWRELLRGETPAINEIGFNTELGLQPDGVEPDTSLYLKYYADDHFRDSWAKDDPDFIIPPHEDPPYDRDVLLPWAPHRGHPDAASWLRANWSASAFATNRFNGTQDAIEFVEQLHAAGATGVWLDSMMLLPNHNWTPYADALLVQVPEDPARRHELFELIEQVGRPDEDGGELLMDHGQQAVRLWWD